METVLPIPPGRSRRRTWPRFRSSAPASFSTWRTRPKKEIARYYWIEFNRRFALPTACLVLVLIGIPLGLSSKKGGRARVLF